MNEDYYKLLAETEARLDKVMAGCSRLKQDVTDEIQNEMEVLDFLANGPLGIDPD